MERNERVYIPPPKPRGPLPRKYRLGLDPVPWNWRQVSIVLFALAVVMGLAWWRWS